MLRLPSNILAGSISIGRVARKTKIEL